MGPLSIEKLTTINEIPVGGAIAVETGGTPIALVRPNASTVKAVHNCCSHEQYELAPEGWVGDNTSNVPSTALPSILMTASRLR